MGRTSVAREAIPKIFPGGRLGGPIFDLPAFAGAVDLFIALRQDLEGPTREGCIRELLDAFPEGDPDAQAESIVANLNHFAEVNQTVIIRSAFGLRDKEREHRRWILRLFRDLEKNPNIRVVWISQRKLSPQTLAEHPNVIQYSVDELDDTSMLFLLTELTDPRAASPNTLATLAGRLNGHPATAHFVARLVKDGQRSLESVLAESEMIAAFQDRFLRQLISDEIIGEAAMRMLLLLSYLPAADFALLQEICDDLDRAALSKTLADLTDSCLLTYSMATGYKLPEIVRSNILHNNERVPYDLLEKASAGLGRRIADEDVEFWEVEAVIFLSVTLHGHIPASFRKFVTGGVLHDLVEQHYRLGFQFAGEWKKHFEMAAKLAELVDVVETSQDGCETILFNGADSLVRIGRDPRPLVERMTARAFPSAEYVMGSYFYHQKRDLATAKMHLRRAERARVFTKRTARLLAKVCMQEGDARSALDVLDRLGDQRVNRDSGLLSQKIRCLNAMGRKGDAAKLMNILKTIDDDYGEYENLLAASCLREGKYQDALVAIEKAKAKPKSNKLNLILLEAAIKIDAGMEIDVEEVCKLAVATGLMDDAYSLRARLALREGRWADAEKKKTSPCELIQRCWRRLGNSRKSFWWRLERRPSARREGPGEGGPAENEGKRGAIDQEGMRAGHG